MRRVGIGMVAAVAALALAGCSAMLLGQASSGRYAASQDPRSREQISSDRAVASSVRNRLLAGKIVKATEVSVDAYNGVVILRGAVNSPAQRATAEAVARSISGVKDVRNELSVRG